MWELLCHHYNSWLELSPPFAAVARFEICRQGAALPTVQLLRVVGLQVFHRRKISIVGQVIWELQLVVFVVCSTTKLKGSGVFGFAVLHFPRVH